MRDVSALHWAMKMLADEYVRRCNAQGLNVKITDCVRSKAEQDECLRKGTTQVGYGYSFHNWGLAFDICKNDKTCAYPDYRTKEGKKWWNACGTIGKALGLFWGGDWESFPDRPHFQLNAYGTCKDLIKAYTLPNYFLAHKDYKAKTPTTPITPASSKKKILWLQVKLIIKGYAVTLNGKWDAATTKALKAFWKDATGRNCTGKLCAMKCVEMLV